jgi:hypothetical protein
MLQDSKSIEELELMNTSGSMMMQQQGAPKSTNYTQVFKGEKDFYELIKYEQFLDDAEDAYLFKMKA